MNPDNHRNQRTGAVLLVVLFIVMAITIVSLGFISKSSGELSYSRNMSLHAEMDYLAESGLEHARGLVLNPQDVSTAYFTGAAAQQIVAGSDDYYDITVNKLSENNYEVTSDAYRLVAGERIGQSTLQGQLRLDPCIGLWIKSNGSVPAEIVVTGDVYCSMNFTNQGYINGDVFVGGSNVNNGTVTGRQNVSVSASPIPSVALSIGDYSSQYFYNGSGPYTVKQLAVEYGVGDTFPEPGSNNPANVYYCSSDLTFRSDFLINGTIVVKDDLIIEDNDTAVSINPVKNMPALIVGHDLKVNDNNQTITANGLVKIVHHIDLHNKPGTRLTVTGALIIAGDVITNTTGCIVRVTASADNAAIETYDAFGDATRWSPAGGAFFKSITRN